MPTNDSICVYYKLLWTLWTGHTHIEANEDGKDRIIDESTIWVALFEVKITSRGDWPKRIELFTKRKFV